MKKRSIGLCILLSLITFGIYGIYWIVVINNDMNTLADPPKKTSGGAVILLSIITCGIYSLFWIYKMGKLQDDAFTKYGMTPENHAVLYLVLQLFGLGIVSIALMQSALNKFAQN